MEKNNFTKKETGNYYSNLQKHELSYVLFLPFFYLILMTTSLVFNPFSTITLTEILITTIIAVIISLIYLKISTLLLKCIFKNVENKPFSNEEAIIISSKLIFFNGNLLVIWLLTALSLLFIINFHLGIILLVLMPFGFLISVVISSIKIFQYNNINPGLFKKILAIIFIALITTINPIVLMSYIPVRSTIADIRVVKNKDMKPTISPGNVVVIDKISGLFVKPDYNELVITESPVRTPGVYYPFYRLVQGLNMDNYNYIRRIIAKSGDSVSIKKENGYILNNKLVNEEYLQETKNNLICELANHCNQNKISKNSYYLLCDNRNSCQDSRIWSEVNQKYLKGKLFSVIWPKSEIRILH